MIYDVENSASHLSNEYTLEKTGLIVMDYSRKNLFDSIRYDLRSKLGVSID